jgi:enoyl-CoA hydratase
MLRTREMAATIAAMAPLAIEGVLEAVEHGSSIDDGLLSEAHIFGRLCGTADKHEGLTAFLEKRKPQWKNN